MRPILLCLHGWGGTKESFDEIKKSLAGLEVEILNPELPGFGQEPDPPRAWNNDDYADWVELYLAEHVKGHDAHRPLYIIGHSHGARVSIVLTLKWQHSDFLQKHHLELKHLFLCAPSGIQKHDVLKRALGYALAKTGKALLRIPVLSQFSSAGRRFLYKLLGVHDYERASPVMQQTLQKVREEIMLPHVHELHVPCDVFWERPTNKRRSVMRTH